MSNQNSSGGVSIFTLLGVAFIILKLTSVIDWSWWWVTAPLWGPFTLALIFLLAATPFWLAANKTPQSKVDAYRRALA
jgi:phosphoglycerol transferase MdoB-like AlkP superfamily enzyme